MSVSDWWKQRNQESENAWRTFSAGAAPRIGGAAFGTAQVAPYGTKHFVSLGAQMAFSSGAMTVVPSDAFTTSGFGISFCSRQLLGVGQAGRNRIRTRVFVRPSPGHELKNGTHFGKRESFQRSGCLPHLPNAMLAEKRPPSRSFNLQPSEGNASAPAYLNAYSAVYSVRKGHEGYEYGGNGLPPSPEALEEDGTPKHDGVKSSDPDPNIGLPQVSTLSMQPVKHASNPRVGYWITVGLFLLCGGALVALDLTHSKDKLLSAGSFVLTSPFMLSAVTTAFLGYLVVPILKHLKAAQILRIEGPTAHVVKSGTPTLGGLFFIPMGVAVAGFTTGFKSVGVKGAVMVTFAMFAVGLMDDCLAFLRSHNYGLPGPLKLLCQFLIGIAFFLWSEYTNPVPTNKIDHMIWFPAPFGLVDMGKWYLPLTAFCCAAMSNGVNLTDGLDGLAAGTAAIALIAMSAVVFPKLPALGAFGSSMAGACLGFIVHNKYKAKIFMGDTGSLALGGCLAAMAHSSGMFIPLLIASGIFVIETLSVIGQVMYFKFTKRYFGKGHRWLRMAPFHHHLELIGFSEPAIVVMAYTLGAIFGILAVFIMRTL